MSLWCLLWLVYNGYNYIYLSWRIFSNLKWLSLALLVNPCFWLWVLFFTSVWKPLELLVMPWLAKYDRENSRTKITLLVLIVPPVLGLALQYIGPYFYPVILGGDDGTHVILRFIPILGGTGYDSSQ